jgi:putative heme-binding domain-containing protein
MALAASPWYPGEVDALLSARPRLTEVPTMKRTFAALVFWTIVAVLPAASFADPLSLHLRSRQSVENQAGSFQLVERPAQWDPHKTAVVICDMWDHHHCKGAERRVAEMAPRMNEVVNLAREQGVLIIHCPSACMKFYEGTPQRKLAQQAPKVETKAPLSKWCRLDPAKEAPLPIDDSDGGCDCQPKCPTGHPWTRQISTIDVRDGDAVTDNEEAFYLLQQRGIDNVIVMGVHTNMCVLGRPFSIRQMVNQGKNVVLMRDMTDSMYNSQMRPQVSHFRGTELVVEHIEKYWCPTIASTDLTGKAPFRFSEDKRPHLAFLVNDNHYDAQRTMPQFAQGLQDKYGYYVSMLRVEKGRVAGLEALKTADLLALFVRREPLPPEQIDEIKAYLDAGKPLVALRTASHAFAVSKGSPPAGSAEWRTFDPDVLGGNYRGHYNAKDGADVETVIGDAAKHPILAGVEPTSWHAVGELYQVRPVNDDCNVLLKASIPGQPQEPVAWFRFYKQKAPVFYTSLGHPEHFGQPQFVKLLTNAVAWALSKPAPTAGLKPYHAAKLQASGAATPPAEAMKFFTVPADLEIEQVLHEPEVAQPLFLNFDERGRMWVIQYLQYPFPAGLKILSEDKFLRATYDKVPPPPPHHFVGRDKITIHEDTDGDGIFDKHKTFVDGLNIATAVERGRGGVWVLNPPYLLFYPDRNNDDVPDGDPEVHLSGFGLEDTHSVVNSLQWGPDGWLYAAQGSTVSADILRPGDKQPVRSMGQLIWRYHPETRRYEIFAEGGGNAFGLEIDSQGRVFSGHNGGDTRGFHYVQGGYYQKGFAKHGPLSNPYTFGYFPAMKHDKVPRFTHCTIIYEGGALPSSYAGKLFGVHPLLSHVVISQVDRDGSSFKTKDVGHAVDSSDSWFRPVDVKVGPDGAIYVADLYEGQIAHLLHHDGKIDPTNGRIYRIKAKGAAPIKPFDLGRMSGAELVSLLSNPNKWFRRTAIRLLGDRHDASLTPQLRGNIDKDKGQLALESLWALNAGGGLSEALALHALDHANPYVRDWTVRLLGDANSVSPAVAQKLAALAVTEPDVEVRSQLASTARRLPAGQCLPIVRGLLTHGEDVGDIHLPLLLWWAIESKADVDRTAVLALFEDSSLWDQPIVEKHILSRLMRRWAQAGSRKDLTTCAQLLRLSPGDAHGKQLIKGFEEAFQGRRVGNLPAELVEAMSRLGGQSLSLGLRRSQPEAVAKALALIADEKAEANERLQLVQILGEAKQPQAVPVLLKVATTASDDGLKMAALTSLAAYDSPEIGNVVLQDYGKFSDDVRSVAQTLLVGRKPWALELLAGIDAGNIDARSIPVDVARKLTAHRDERIAAGVQKHWGQLEGATTEQMREQIARLQDVVRAGTGSPYAGKKLFATTCAKCHRLFGEGGQIGPDLTTFKRDDVTNMLTNIVNPSAEIREGFETYTALTADGRVVTGFLVDRDNQVAVLRGVDGQNISLAQDQIEELLRVKKSLMPEGQLIAMTEQQVRDLLAYLRSTQPLAD